MLCEGPTQEQSLVLLGRRGLLLLLSTRASDCGLQSSAEQANARDIWRFGKQDSVILQRTAKSTSEGREKCASCLEALEYAFYHVFQ